MSRIVCFGEVLWDVFPNYKNIGGAPLNVALRLNALGNEVSMISGVGNDENGRLILEYLIEKGLNAEAVIVNKEQATSCVRISLDKEGSASYTIEYPCAWDFIQFTDVAKKLVKESDVLIFGSLAARNDITQNSLVQLLDIAPYKVFDVNLRAPHYNYDAIKKFIKKADFVKFNDEEIDEISKEIGCHSRNLKDQVIFISKKYNVQTICVTLGGDGALLFRDDHFYRHQGYPVNVKDTVGAGDSFLASLIDQLFRGSNPEKALSFACAIGALVASKEGANPEIDSQEIFQIQKGN